MSYLRRTKGTVTTKPMYSPVLVTPALGTPASGVMTNLTGTLTSPTFVTPALGTPASGVVTNLTGTFPTATQDAITRLGTVTTGTFEGTLNSSTTFTTNRTLRAWMNLNGYSFGLRDSFNVSSATDHGTGDYTMNIDTDLANAASCIQGLINYGSGTNTHMFTPGCKTTACDPTVGSIRACCLYIAGATQNHQDCQYMHMQVFSD